METINQSRALSLFVQLTNICQTKCQVLNGKDDLLTKDNTQCLEKCSIDFLDGYQKMRTSLSRR